MKRDDAVLLKDIAGCVDRINEYMQNRGKKEFFQDAMLQDAVLRRLEVIGEIAKNITSVFREKHPEIQWRKEVENE